MHGDIVLVRDQHDGVALLVEPLEQPHDFDTGRAVEVSGRFVGQQNGRIVHQRPGDGHALALSAGELARLVVHALFQVDVTQRLLSALEPRFARRAAVNQRQFHIVQRGSARQQIEGLKHEPDLLVADPRQLVIGHIADQAAVDVVLALRRSVQTTDQVHQRRFARAGRTHDGHVLATLDLDIAAGDRVDLLIAHDVSLPKIERRFNCSPRLIASLTACAIPRVPLRG